MDTNRNIIIGAIAGVVALVSSAAVALHFLTRDEIEPEPDPPQQNPPSLPPAPKELLGSENATFTIRKSSLCDPVTTEMMTDPHITKCGHTFQKEIIDEVIKKQGMCPICRTPLMKEDCHPDFAMKKITEQAKKKTQ